MSFPGPLRHEGARTSLARWWRRPRAVVPAPPEGGAGRSWGAAPEGGDCTDEAGARPHAREVVARRLHRRLLVLPGRAAALAGPRAGATTDLGGPDDGPGGRRARDPVPVQPAEPGARRAPCGSASPRRGASAGVHRLPGDGRDLQRTEPRGLPPAGAGPRRHGRALRLPPRLRRRVPLGGAAVPGRSAAGPRSGRPPARRRRRARDAARRLGVLAQQLHRPPSVLRRLLRRAGAGRRHGGTDRPAAAARRAGRGAAAVAAAPGCARPGPDGVAAVDRAAVVDDRRLRRGGRRCGRDARGGLPRPVRHRPGRCSSSRCCGTGCGTSTSC